MPEILGPADRLEVIFDGPRPGTTDPVRVRVSVNGIDLGGRGDLTPGWWEKIGSLGWRVSVLCSLPGSANLPLRAYVPKHSPAEYCDCPNPRPGRPFHCAVGVPSARD